MGSMLNPHMVVMDASVRVNGEWVKIPITYDANQRFETVDDGLAFFISQLSFIEAKIYEVKYRKIVFQDFVPIDTSDPTGS